MSLISVIEFNGDFGFIPSRRQVDYQGGYVNNWTTREFSTYVNGRVPIERDHGEGQGFKDDDGFESFLHDLTYFDIIHTILGKRIRSSPMDVTTISSMNYIYNQNPNVKFEVGTEESIRKFNDGELKLLLHQLSKFPFFDNIEYVVVQFKLG